MGDKHTVSPAHYQSQFHQHTSILIDEAQFTSKRTYTLSEQGTMATAHCAGGDATVYKFTDADVVHLGRLYWDDCRIKMSLPNVEAILWQGDDRSPETVGAAAAMGGLPGLLASRNLLPYGPDSWLIGLAIQQFDLTPALVNEGHLTWLYQKHMVIRYYFQVMDHLPNHEIRYHQILGTGSSNKVHEHFVSIKNQIATLLIAKCGFGWDFGATGMRGTLHELGTQPEYEARYYTFVLPMAHFLCTEMNPHGALNFRDIVTKIKLVRIEEYMKKRLEKGIWSQELLMKRIKLPVSHQWHVTYLDRDVTKGVEYKFARLCSLIVPNYKWPFNQRLGRPDKLYITQQELDLMHTGYDQHTIARFDQPSYP